MVKNEYRIKEEYNGDWVVQSHWTKEYYENKYPYSLMPYYEAVSWVCEYTSRGSYKNAKTYAEKLIARETFEGKIFYPPFPDAVQEKKWWKFW